MFKKMKKGFSLVEVLVTAAIFTVIIAGITSVLNVGRNSFTVNMAAVDLQESQRNALDRMVRELRSAQSASNPTGGSDNYSIVFVNKSGDTVQYFLSGSISSSQGAKLTRRPNNNASSDSYLTDNIMTKLKFTKSSSLVTIELQGELRGNKRVLQKNISASLAEKVRLRNVN